MPPVLHRNLAIDFQLAESILKFFRRPTVRILVVTDTLVTFDTSFGIGAVVDEIRASDPGYADFVVDLARWGATNEPFAENAAATQSNRVPRYTGFRFSSQNAGGGLVIDEYDEIWCFGFAPGNDGSTSDANIWNSPYAATEADLAAAARWMDNGGGMLAMGDHHYLGAAMCARIPRVRSMRRWTNQQAVPPIGGPQRVDTNQPMNAAQDAAATANPAEIPGFAQEDAVPQPLEVRLHSAGGIAAVLGRSRPHPLLCGQSLGVIDVLPDHPHEGIVFEDAQVDTTATYSFDGGAASGDEYPVGATTQPKPEVVAWGNTLPDPPYNQNKGDSPAKRFGIIGAYDGDGATVGRVVVDATWHHWMDMNILDLRAENGDEWKKIRQYFVNTAVWLARSGQRSRMLWYSTFWSTLSAQTIEEFHVARSVFWLGRGAFDVIGQAASDCLVFDWLIDVREVFDRFALLEIPRIPDLGPVCLTCPPLEVFAEAALGGLVRRLLPARDAVLAGHVEELKAFDEELDELGPAGLRDGLAELTEPLEQVSRAYREYARTLEEVVGGGRKR
jgi:hypothetical protein